MFGLPTFDKAQRDQEVEKLAPMLERAKAARAARNMQPARPTTREYQIEIVDQSSYTTPSQGTCAIEINIDRAKTNAEVSALDGSLAKALAAKAAFNAKRSC